MTLFFLIAEPKASVLATSSETLAVPVPADRGRLPATVAVPSGITGVDWTVPLISTKALAGSVDATFDIVFAY